MAEDTTLQYNFPYEQYKNFSFSYTTGSYNSSGQIINLSIASETGAFPTNLPFKLTWFNVTDYPSVYDDPSIEIILVTGIHQSGFLVTRGREGTIASGSIAGKNYGLIQSPLSSDYEDKWKYFANPDNTAYLFDDFDYGTSASTVLGWTSNGGSAGISTLVSSQKRPGFVQLLSTSSSRETLYRLNNKLFRTDSGPLTYKTAIHFNHSNATEGTGNAFEFRWGLGDATVSGALPSNGLYFHYITLSGSGWYIVSAKDSTYNSVLTDITGRTMPNASFVALSYKDFKISIENSGLVRFYYNNSEVSGSPLTTNIPWGSGYEISPFYQSLNINSANTARMETDYCEISQDFTGQRTQPLLMTDLVSYWPLYETGGIAYDSHGSNHLTGISANPLSTGGVLISGRYFDRNQALWREEHLLSGQGSGIGLSVLGWFNTIYTGSTVRYLVAVRDSTNNNRQWSVSTNNSTISFNVSPNGISENTCASDAFYTGVWNFFCATYNNLNNKISIRLNNNYSSLVTNTGIYANPPPAIVLGGYKVSGSAPTTSYSGSLSEIGIIQRALTTGEQDFLFNNSGAMLYPFSHFNEQ